jgi:hypothetical protein
MQDPLQINVQLKGVDTDFPLIPEGDYELQVVASTVDPNKDKTGLNWNLTLATTSPITGVDGRDVKVGTKLFAVNALQAREDSKDAQAFIRSLGETVDAIFGTDKNTRPDFSQEVVSSALGKTVLAHVIIDEYQGNKNNKVRRFKKPVTV